MDSVEPNGLVHSSTPKDLDDFSAVLDADSAGQAAVITQDVSDSTNQGNARKRLILYFVII